MGEMMCFLPWGWGDGSYLNRKGRKHLIDTWCRMSLARFPFHFSQDPSLCTELWPCTLSLPWGLLKEQRSCQSFCSSLFLGPQICHVGSGPTSPLCVAAGLAVPPQGLGSWMKYWLKWLQLLLTTVHRCIGTDHRTQRKLCVTSAI
jgi:hypothetical protein